MSRPKSESSDSILDQISAFEKLLRHAMARFSKERLYEMLQTVHEDMTNAVRYPKSARTAAEAKKPSTAPTIKIRSMGQVRTTVKTIEKKGDKAWTDREKQAVKYFETFQKDVAYLTDLRKYFAENIHSVLLKDYFDPADRVKKPSTARSDTGVDSGRGLSSRSSTKSTIQKSAKKPLNETSDKHQTEKQRLSELITEMDEINSKWSGLLADRDLSLDDFDPDSQHELTQFSNYSGFEPLLRLVPDVFVKCYKAIDVAREWWKLANVVYSGRLPLKSKRLSTPAKSTVEKPQTPAKTPSAKSQAAKPVKSAPSPKPEEVVDNFVKAAKEIKQNITEITEHIRENEQKLENLGEEMKALETRDGRIDNLTNNFESMDSKLQSAKDDYSNFLLERQKTLNQISQIPRGSDQHFDLTKQANSMDAEVDRRQSALRLLEFEKAVLQEDYLLELELRPSFIHFIGDIKQQVIDIKEEINKKQSQRSHLEKQLSVLKANTDKLKKEMQNIGDNGENEQLSRQLSVLTKEIDEDLEVLRDLKSEQSFISTSDDVDLDDYLSDFSTTEPEDDGGHFSRLEVDQKSGSKSTISVKSNKRIRSS